MFVFDLFEKKKTDAAAGRFVGGTSQDARVKNALDNAYRAVPAAKSPEEAALGYIDIQNSLNKQQDKTLSQQDKTNQQQTQQINALVTDMQRKEKNFRDLNAQVANMPGVTPQQMAKMAQDIETAHDNNPDQPVNVADVISKQATPAQATQTVSEPGPGASVIQIAQYQKAKDQGASTVAPTQAPAKAPAQTTRSGTAQSAGAQAFGAIAGQLDQTNKLPSQTYSSKTTPAAMLKKSATQTDQMPSSAAQPGDEINIVDPDQLATANNKQMSEAYSEGDANQGSLNWTALRKAWLARSPRVDWQFGKNKTATLYQQQMYALLQIFGNIKDPTAQEELIQNTFSVRQQVQDLLREPVAQQYIAHYQTWYNQQMAKQQDQAQSNLLAPTGQPVDKGINAEPKQGDLFRESAWHAGNNDWSSEHDQWAKESAETNLDETPTDYQKRRQRERDVDAGRPVKSEPRKAKTDYEKKREQDRKDMKLGEHTTNYWKKLQQQRFLQEHKKAFGLVKKLEQSIKDIK